MFDDRDPVQAENALRCNTDIMRVVIELGGALSGEHGIGTEKLEFMPLVYNADDLEAMRRVRDVFDPQHLSNPGKAIPSHRCWEVKGHESRLAFAVTKAHG